MPDVQVIFYQEEDETVPVLEWLDDLIPKARAKRNSHTFTLER